MQELGVGEGRGGRVFLFLHQDKQQQQKLELLYFASEVEEGSLPGNSDQFSDSEYQMTFLFPVFL